MGATVNVITGYLISRVQLRTLVVVSGLITMTASPNMATIHVHESYWRAAFWVLLLSPVNPDGTMAALIAEDMKSSWGLLFADDLNSGVYRFEPPLAGGVFNEICQFGHSVGTAVTAAIASSVTAHSSFSEPADTLLQGYRAAFWTIFAATALVLPVSFLRARQERACRQEGLVARSESDALAAGVTMRTRSGAVYSLEPGASARGSKAVWKSCQYEIGVSSSSSRELCNVLGCAGWTS